MGEAATGPLPAIAGLGEVIAVSERVIAELRATRDMVRRDLAQCGPMPELDRMEFRLAELEAAYRRGLGDAMFRAVGPVLSAPVLAAVPAVPHRHRRVPRPRGERPMWPAAVKGLIPLGALGAVLKHAWKPALRHHA